MTPSAPAAAPSPSYKIAMVVAPIKPRDEEVTIPHDRFTKAHHAVTVFSSTLQQIQGMMGGVFQPDQLLGSLDVARFDAIVFVGGEGAQAYIENALCHAICTKAVAQGKVLAAICIAPAILAHAGVLKGRKATAWDGAKDHLATHEAIYAASPVVTDGLIVTANGPTSADQFATAVLNALKNRPAK